MSYRFTPDNDINAELRRIAQEQVAAAISEGEQLDEDEAIHQLRKRCKKIRALVRLLRPELGDIYTRENAHYRNLAAGLGASRDAASLLSAFQSLGAEESMPHIAAHLQSQLAQESQQEALQEAITAFRAGGARIDEWTLDSDKPKQLKKGYRRGYKRARKAMRAAQSSGSRADLHTWRKRVKDHWYHTRLLQKPGEKTMRKRRDKLHRLAQALGDYRDLLLLREALMPIHNQFGDETFTLLDLAEARLKKLEKDIDKLAQPLFKEKPGKLSVLN